MNVILVFLLLDLNAAKLPKKYKNWLIKLIKIVNRLVINTVWALM